LLGLPDDEVSDVDRAAAAAREAFYSEWKFYGVEQKRALFAKLKKVLHAMSDELAAAKVQPQGGAGIPPLIERIIDYYVAKLDDGVGTGPAGKLADLVVIEGDIGSSASDIRNVRLVFKDGLGYDAKRLTDAVKGLVGMR